MVSAYIVQFGAEGRQGSQQYKAIHLARNKHGANFFVGTVLQIGFSNEERVSCSNLLPNTRQDVGKKRVTY